MKRFKHNNSQNIVTAQNLWQRIIHSPYWAVNQARARQWEKEFRKNLKPLGKVTIDAQGGLKIDVPKIPPIKENFKKAAEAISGAQQADEKAAILQAGKLGIPGAIYLLNNFAKVVEVSKLPPATVLLVQLSAGSILSALLIKLKTFNRKMYMNAGGGKLFDDIQKIFDLEFDIVKYKKEQTSGFGSFGASKNWQWGQPQTFKMKLSEVAEALDDNRLTAPENSGMWGNDKEIFHFKNEADVEKINKLMHFVLKDDAKDVSKSKLLPYLGPAAAAAAGASYRAYSNWSNTKVDEKNTNSPLNLPAPSPDKRAEALQRLQNKINPGKSSANFKPQGK